MDALNRQDELEQIESTEEQKQRAFTEECRKAIQIAGETSAISFWSYYLNSKLISQSFGGGEASRYGYPKSIPGGAEEVIRFGGIHPEDEHYYREMYRRIDDGASSSDCTIRVMDHSNGKYEWHHMTMARQTEDETDPVAIGFGINVELQKEAQIRYERENRLRQELVKDSVIYYRINLSSELVEELYSEAMDTTRIQLPILMEDLIAAGMFEGVYEKDRQKLMDRLNPEKMQRNYYSGKTTESFTYRRYLPGKGLRWLKASIAKLKRVSSDDVIAFFTAIDIDEEKKDQILFQDVMDEEIESLITMKVATRQIRILKENRVLVGYEPGQEKSAYFPLNEEFRNSLFQDMIAEDVEKASEFISTDKLIRELSHSPIVQTTYRTKRKDGMIRRKKLRVFYLDESKQDLIFVRRDITDLYNEQQRQSAAIQRAMDEAKAANEAKSDFLSRMSHDMRTPLNAIIGYSGSVLREGATEEQKDEFLDDIHSSGEYLLGIINDVLDMTKIESNKMVLHPEAYTCAEFKENIETVVFPLCEKKGVTFIIDFPENIQIPVMLDKVRFSQIFVNILSNAVKFTPSGGTITFKAVRKEREDGLLDEIFTIADTGCGMSEEFLPHAFDSFSQEYAGQSMHNEQGTGLGLSIVKQLVELMDGSISVESKLGEGTTFTVNMQITPADMERLKIQKSVPEGGLKGKHLLLCEDHPMNRKIAIRLLEKEGCTVDTAEDGARGVETFSKSKVDEYDAILMDIRMPNMDGLTAAKTIRDLKREDAVTVPIIAMTANAFVEDRRASMAAGMNAHVSKPIDPEVLYRTLYQQITNRHVIRTPKILVVDDVEMNAALIARVLKDKYETIIALSGKEALKELKKNPYIIAVITDVQMPEMNGEELILKIRQNPSYDQIALIANTQFGDSHMEERLIRDGADDFIYKPTAPSLILSRVENVLGKYR